MAIAKPVFLIRTTARLKQLQPTIAIIAILVTVGLITRFFWQHSSYISRLAHLNPLIIIAIMGLYCLMLGIWTWQYATLLRLCGVRIPGSENFLLTCYSSVINFFGPLQSGPGVRAAYLKAKYQLRARDYLRVSLWYYGFFAVFSGTFLLLGNRAWWQIVLGIVIAAVASVLFCRLLQQRHVQHGGHSTSIYVLIILAGATLLQVLLTSVIYFLELHSVSPHLTYGQALSYTGAGNFALFVSLTPGAIGFREAFLIFANRLHHIATPLILSASVIDRGVYVLFLSIIFFLTLSLHAKQRFSNARQRANTARTTAL